MGYGTEQERRDLTFRLLIADCMRAKGLVADCDLVDAYNGKHVETWRVSSHSSRMMHLSRMMPVGSGFPLILGYAP